MGTCEMCGKETPGIRRALIEGTLMNVCAACVKFGVEQAGPKTEVTGRSRVASSLEQRAKRQRSRDIYEQMEEELVEDYGDRIRQARQARGMSVEDLGKKLMERAGTLSKVEAGTFHPPDPLVAKLEKELEIKLKEKVDAPAGIGGQPAGKKPSGPMTLGDLIKREIDKKD